MAPHEGTHSLSAVQSFCVAPSVGSGTHLLPLPVDILITVAERMPCDAEARREPSAPLSSFFRKS